MAKKPGKACSTGEGRGTRYVSPPEGWAIQDCKEDMVTLVRTKKVGQWAVDYKGDEIPKDYYVSAETVELTGSPRLKVWEVTSYHPNEGHNGLKVRGRDTAIHEMIAQALAIEAEHEVLATGGSRDDAGKAFRKVLSGYRKRYGIQVH